MYVHFADKKYEKVKGKTVFFLTVLKQFYLLLFYEYNLLSDILQEIRLSLTKPFIV